MSAELRRHRPLRRSRGRLGALPGRRRRSATVSAAVGAGPAPLWVPEAGKRPTAVYLGGPYKGAPLSIIAVVPKQAGPFDFGDEVVRIGGLRQPGHRPGDDQIRPPAPADRRHPDRLPHPARGRRPRGLRRSTRPAAQAERVSATVTSDPGAPGPPLRPLRRGQLRQARLQAEARPGAQGRDQARRPPGPERHLPPQSRRCQPSSIVVRLPHSAFLDQAHISTICTRVQFAAGAGNGASARRAQSTATSPPRPRCSTSRSKARSTCAPPTTTCPTWSSPCTAWSTSRSVGPDRLGQRRHQGDLRRRPRRAALTKVVLKCRAARRA